MARKIKNTVDYFPHVVSHGKTLTIIEARFSHLGYSFFFKLLEHLGKADNHYLDFRDETEMQYVFADIKIDEDKGIEILNLMAKLGTIDSKMWKKHVVYSQNFVDGVEDAYKRRNNKCMQLDDLCKHLKLNVDINAKNVDINTQTILYDSKQDNTKEEKPDFIGDILHEFTESYKQTGSEYVVLNPGKERKSISKLVQLYKKKYPNADSAETIEGLRLYFDAVMQINDKWLSQNMSPSILMSKFNEINKTLKNEKTKPSLKGATDGELKNIFVKHFGDEQN